MQDLTVALTHNHLVLSRLAEGASRTPDRKLRNALFDDLAKGLGGHFSALERVVVPSLLRARASLTSDVLHAAMALKRELAALLTMDRRTPAFEDRLLPFCHAVLRLAEQERLHLLPLVRQALSDREQADLGGDVAARMESRLGDHPVLQMPARLAEPPMSFRAGLEEAAVVLSSLARSSAASPASPACEGDELAPA